MRRITFRFAHRQGNRASIRRQRSKRCDRCWKIPTIEKIGQNLKYDMIVLRSAGVEVAGVQFDTMVASYLLDAGERNHNLDELAGRYLNHTTTKIRSPDRQRQKSEADGRSAGRRNHALRRRRCRRGVAAGAARWPRG